MAIQAKRIIDLLVAGAGLIILSPVFLIIAAMVRIMIGRPVFFRQQRPGLRGEPFMLLKFRTMTEARDMDGNLLPDAERLKGFGRFLRSTSLDELPELINVLSGAMSLVGPRPLLMQYLPRYTSEQARRHEVKPGITGWAQVNGRNDITWEEKFAFDVWYVDHQSLGLDARIVLRTIRQVLKREGIASSGHATAPEFMGSKATEA